MLEGGCFCGAVRYRVTGAPFHETICHCIDCRRVAAAPMVGWFTVRSADFACTGEQPRLFFSSADVERGFCPHCGTMLTFAHARSPDEIDIAIGSLDAADAVIPLDHVWTSQKVPWIVIADGLPQFPRGRSDP